MLRDMLYVVHAITHPFRNRTLVFDLAEGGGVDFYLGCEKCGELAPIDRYKALELKKTQEAIHLDEFLEHFKP
jgi:hypothetical protein